MGISDTDEVLMERDSEPGDTGGEGDREAGEVPEGKWESVVVSSDASSFPLKNRLRPRLLEAGLCRSRVPGSGERFFLRKGEKPRLGGVDGGEERRRGDSGS